MVETKTLSIRHVTTYSYDEPVYYALQQLRLTPRATAGQVVRDWTCTVRGGTKQLSFTDSYRNSVELVLLGDGVTEVEIECAGVVEVEDRHGVVGKHRGFAPLWLYLEETALTSAGSNIGQLAARLKQDCADMDEVALLHVLSAEVLGLVKYEIGQTDASTTAEGAMTAGHGVCQDHAHIMISVARQLGMPARYVSGYLLMDGQTQQDASHAWCEVWTKGLGWIGFDVSNGICPDARYVRVGVGRDYADAAPIRGVRQGNGAENLHVSLQVQQ